ncbi:unnamed protein product [Amoebophrya sp. A120]|nr:unnamed protein product [Amoebophrya sp. A120]|eukprot:GSA120T00024900001.1
MNLFGGNYGAAAAAEGALDFVSNFSQQVNEHGLKGATKRVAQSISSSTVSNFEAWRNLRQLEDEVLNHSKHNEATDIFKEQYFIDTYKQYLTNRKESGLGLIRDLRELVGKTLKSPAATFIGALKLQGVPINGRLGNQHSLTPSDIVAQHLAAKGIHEGHLELVDRLHGTTVQDWASAERAWLALGMEELYSERPAPPPPQQLGNNMLQLAVLQPELPRRSGIQHALILWYDFRQLAAYEFVKQQEDGVEPEKQQAFFFQVWEFLVALNGGAVFVNRILENRTQFERHRAERTYLALFGPNGLVPVQDDGVTPLIPFDWDGFTNKQIHDLLRTKLISPVPPASRFAVFQTEKKAILDGRLQERGNTIGGR